MTKNSNNSCLKFTKENITLRREHVLRLAAQGMTQQEICNQLGNVVSRPLIALDLQYLKETAAQTINLSPFLFLFAVIVPIYLF
jgi:hypothetical protein